MGKDKQLERKLDKLLGDVRKGFVPDWVERMKRIVEEKEK